MSARPRGVTSQRVPYLPYSEQLVSSIPDNDDTVLVESIAPELKNIRREEISSRNQLTFSRYGELNYSEMDFLDIGLFPDCVGGSRAKGFFFAPFGLENHTRDSSRSLNDYNYISSLAHKNVVCAWGDDGYNFNGALYDLCTSGAGKEFTAHAVAFNPDTSTLLHRQIDPISGRNRTGNKTRRNALQAFYYPRGFTTYAKRLQAFRAYISRRIDTFGGIVSTGRMAKLIFLILSHHDMKKIASNRESARVFSDIVGTWDKERITVIPCVESISHLPKKMVTSADMVIAYGKDNAKRLRAVMEEAGVPFSPGAPRERFKTAGVVFDKVIEPYFFPLFGLTPEFFDADEREKKWIDKEKKDFEAMLSSLDSGNKYDRRNDFAQEKFLSTRESVLSKKFVSPTRIIDKQAPPRRILFQ